MLNVPHNELASNIRGQKDNGLDHVKVSTSQANSKIRKAKEKGLKDKTNKLDAQPIKLKLSWTMLKSARGAQANEKLSKRINQQ